ncbi:MAG: protein kinase [Deltaproteobacteria bacterium]|nr:protein kinase [Deltaproteobacteria bacterium]
MTTGSSKTLLGRIVSLSPEVERLLAAQEAQPVDPAWERQERAVMFTDIVGSTSFFEQRGDEAGMAMVERHNSLLLPLVEAHAGTLVKTIGDAIMASFETAGQAVGAAIGMQAALKTHNRGKADPDRIRVRIGINFGPVICRQKDLFGDTVNAAARVEALARGDQILISAAVNAQLDSDFPFPRRLFDAVRVKGKLAPIEVYAVLWDPEAASAVAEPAPACEPGQLLGKRFEIEARLGEGGMGQVFQARDLVLDETVALKFIRPDLVEDPATLARFKREVKLARSISHPGICRIHEFLEMDGLRFLSMELIRGRTLAERLREPGPVPVETALDYLNGICAALQAAHDKGITHRDLKPANVMIEQDSGRVVLMDFGIARPKSRRSETAPGMVVGSPEYMSPEQVRGENVGPASDIYALGVILYEMLGGRPPHVAETPMAVAIQHVTAEPRPLRELRADLPEPLYAAVARCMSKEPAGRFASAAELARAVLGDRATLPAPTPSRWWLAPAGALAALLAVLVAWQLWPASSPGPASATELIVSSDSMAHTPCFSPDGRGLAFIQDGEIWLRDSEDERALTHKAWIVESRELAGLSWSAERIYATAAGERGPVVIQVDPQSGKRLGSLDAAAAADRSADGRLALAAPNEHGTFDIALSGPDGADRRVLLAGTPSVSYLRPRWSPDGKRLAIVIHQVGYDSTRDIGVLDAATGALRQLTFDGAGQRAYNTDPTWAPGGEWLAFASKRSGTMTLWWLHARGGEPQPLSRMATEDQCGPDISPDGKRIVFNTRAEQLDVEIVDPGSGAATPVTRKRRPDRFPVFSPDGRLVAYRSEGTGKHFDKHRIVIFDRASGERSPIQGPAGLRDFCFCGPEQIAFAATRAEERFLGLVDRAGSQRMLVRGFDRIWSPACSPDGKQVVFAGKQLASDRRSLWRYALDESTPQRLTDVGEAFYPCWSHDGRLIAYRWAPSLDRLGQAELRLLVPGKPPRTLTGHRSFQLSRRRLRFSGDDRTIYYAQSAAPGGKIWRIPLAGGEPEPVFHLLHMHTFDFDLAPDGALVYAKVNRRGDLHEARNPDWAL